MSSARSPIKTLHTSEREADRIYCMIGAELAKGRQAYVVYPVIEESEKVDLKSATEGFKKLSEVFKGRRVALLHGRMKSDDKERTMKAFAAGEIDVLVSTTVIEVGVDVANATIMLIEHAERFGLSQLHQLRGRVGRGPWKSYGILLHAGKLTEDAERRIEAMTQTNDGFRIAETDLSLRGPGEFFGTRQSGLPQFRVADLLRDAAILEDARIEAQGIIATDPELKDDAHSGLREG